MYLIELSERAVDIAVVPGQRVKNMFLNDYHNIASTSELPNNGTASMDRQ